MPTLPLPGAVEMPSSSEKGLADRDIFAGIDARCRGFLLGRFKFQPVKRFFLGGKGGEFGKCRD